MRAANTSDRLSSSVLRQTHSDFELIVVGDGCTDETEEVVRSFRSHQVSWHNLETNSGSQSFPNNLGITKATGKWIAYLGHDDIWSSDHLAAMRALVDAQTELDFVISGCIYYGPSDSEIYFITGIFDSQQAQFEHFFPPSALAHRREVVDLIGWWRDPRTVAPPVDCELLLRAAHAGLRFASTKKITVHKFAAGHRYLSYLRPDAEQQRASLEDPQAHNPESLRKIVEKCQKQNRFMTMRYLDFSKFENGQLFDHNRHNKGVLRPDLKALSGRIVLEQTGEPRALDWYGLESGPRPFRWSGPNPKPKILIPYTYGGKVRITLCVPAIAVAPLCNIRIAVNGRQADYEIQKEKEGHYTVVFQTHLSESDYSVLVIHTPEMSCPSQSEPRGIAVSDTIIEPVSMATRWSELRIRAAALLTGGGWTDH